MLDYPPCALGCHCIYDIFSVDTAQAYDARFGVEITPPTVGMADGMSERTPGLSGAVYEMLTLDQFLRNFRGTVH